MKLTFKNGRDFEQRLKQLSKEAATKAGYAAVRKGARHLLQKIKANAPVSDVPEGAEIKRKTKSGKVRVEKHNKIVNSLKVKKIRSETPTKVEQSVTTGNAYHASMVEFGSVHNTPNPFMRTAIDESSQEVLDVMAKELDRQLRKRGA